MIKLYTTLTQIIQKPITGILASMGFPIISFINTLSPVLQFLGLFLGVLIGLMSLYHTWLKVKKTRLEIRDGERRLREGGSKK